ncbi:hypothetical protein SDC9_199438 [bioreactor metagenome]|uniref:Uncharacterized protein n=1 Tax=bioreactor metagenome TaxID=1076179 RepID=A0A645IMT2_9ZZZZ|nr:hypothetical protein [Anaerotignum propionicum]MEA5056168.1 hypothetical protein [Anaerotignum propionicum]
MNNKLKLFVTFVVVIVLFIFINKVLVPQNTDNNDRTTDEAIQDNEKGPTEVSFAVDKHMFVESENGYVTSAVCVHNGKSYVLSEDEYLYLLNGGKMEEVLRQRQNLNVPIESQ